MYKTQDEDKYSKKHHTENEKDEQYGSHQKPRVNPGPREGQAVPVSYKTHTVILT